MNKINPLYILALFFTLFIISFFKLSEAKNDLNKEFVSLNQFKQNNYEYKKLKHLWQDNNQEKKLKQIKAINKNIEYKKYKKKYVLVLNSQDNSAKQRFINKVLNTNLKINKLEITKDNILFEIGKTNG